MCDGYCFFCDCYDPDSESCTMPSIDLTYACSLYADEADEKESNSDKKD